MKIYELEDIISNLKESNSQIHGMIGGNQTCDSGSTTIEYFNHLATPGTHPLVLCN